MVGFSALLEKLSPSTSIQDESRIGDRGNGVGGNRSIEPIITDVIDRLL